MDLWEFTATGEGRSNDTNRWTRESGVHQTQHQLAGTIDSPDYKRPT